MANSDELLERFDRLDRYLLRNDVCDLLRDLAAALREARDDTQRLENAIANAMLMASGRWSAWGERARAVEAILDAAMAAEGGEG